MTNSATGSNSAKRMYVLILTWDFSDLEANTCQRLRDYIADESWSQYGNRKSLHQKVWLSNESTKLWRAVYLWESKDALSYELNTMGRVEEMTGIAPDIKTFEVEAIQEGNYSIADLLSVGLARS